MDYTELAQKEFPFEGEFYLSRNKQFNELIFFVHFYEGSKRELLRHIKLVNDLGFDAFAFQLNGTAKDLVKRLPITADGTIGVKHVYAAQIEKLLNEIPGNKIIFSFSNPSASAIEAMAKRRCIDTVAMICDSGPTARFLPSVWKLVRNYKFPVLFSGLKVPATAALSVFWSLHFHKDIQNQLAEFPENFPLLSIRGWKDKLIPPEHIDEVFEPHHNLNWTKLNLPEAEHLTGLRDCRSEYAPSVEAFLKRVATPIIKSI
ncbi:hypothetical protein ACLVWU_01750 [Bdellovibrio sp. HCB290]|uniref:hypothetical protein n=1 Tax=Bdellovibrio sp. HCB290 TaxID=3394356 RepID=UPI0039B64B85